MEQDDAGEHEPTGLAKGKDDDRDAAQVAVGPPEERRDQELRGREREGQDPDDRRHRGRRPEREQKGDRQAVAGEGDDSGRSDPDPLVRPESPMAEGAPLVDGQPRPGWDERAGRRGEPGHPEMVRGRAARFSPRRWSHPSRRRR